MFKWNLMQQRIHQQEPAAPPPALITLSLQDLVVEKQNKLNLRLTLMIVKFDCDRDTNSSEPPTDINI